jgi:hypothetical protein
MTNVVVMTEHQARKTANVVLAAAAAGAAFVILRNPRLRRLAWTVARQYATGPLAIWGTSLVRQSWQESGRSRPA